MSRSYKKHDFYLKDGNNQYMKRQANKKVRNYPICKNIANGRSYKKLACSWDICDYKWIWTRNDAIREYKIKDINGSFWNSAHLFETLEDYLNYREKCTKRK